nr:uncharacterized protein LOC129258284 [Lytechinus pictus]
MRSRSTGGRNRHRHLRDLGEIEADRILQRRADVHEAGLVQDLGLPQDPGPSLGRSGNDDLAPGVGHASGDHAPATGRTETGTVTAIGIATGIERGETSREREGTEERRKEKEEEERQKGKTEGKRKEGSSIHQGKTS